MILQDRWVGQQPLQVRRVVAAGGELHEMGVAVAARQLRQAEPVAVRVQPHRLGVDRHRVAKQEPFGQVAAIQLVSQTRIRSFKLTGTDYLPHRPARQFEPAGQ